MLLFSGVIKPPELAMMTRVLDDYCQEHRIVGRSPARESTASMIIALYRHGFQTADGLKDALENRWASKH
jgi:hypothetical protein